MEEDQAENIDTQLKVTWQRFRVHMSNRMDEIVNTAVEIIRKYNEKEEKGKVINSNGYANTLIAIIMQLATKYRIRV